VSLAKAVGELTGREWFAGLFSSPSSQAASAATTQAGLQNAEIGQQENYVAGQEAQLRNAIAGLGANPYFAGGAGMSPAGYAVNPNNTASFAAPPPPGGGPPNAFAVPQPPNAFAPVPGQPRSAQPVARSVQAQ
jgi:hypothetical protein